MGDIHNYARKRERMVNALHRSALAEEDKALIERFVNYKAAEGIGIPRQEKYLRILRSIGTRHLNGRTYSSLTKDDLVQIISEIERRELTAWTKYDYRLLLKTFLKWVGKTDEIEWIKTTKPRGLPEELLSESDVMAMIDAASSLRDKALIAMLYDGGFRVGELGGLRIKDIAFERYGARVKVAGKTGMRRVLLIWSMPYISQWLEAHPLREDREAPVWVSKGKKKRELDYDAIRVQLQKIARRAGVKKRVNPHIFRHSRSTHVASHLTEAQMADYFGWVQGSRMPSLYVHMSGRDTDKGLLQMYGIESEASGGTEQELRQCPFCKTVNTKGARICINCRKPLAVEEAMARDDKVKEMLAAMLDIMTEDPEMKAKFSKFFE
ncbi:MAG: tyrosine-type recombinase/integrase [Candidatus Methanospirareceae archaeon]